VTTLRIEDRARSRRLPWTLDTRPSLTDLTYQSIQLIRCSKLQKCSLQHDIANLADFTRLTSLKVLGCPLIKSRDIPLHCPPSVEQLHFTARPTLGSPEIAVEDGPELAFRSSFRSLRLSCDLPSVEWSLGETTLKSEHLTSLSLTRSTVANLKFLAGCPNLTRLELIQFCSMTSSNLFNDKFERRLRSPLKDTNNHSPLGNWRTENPMRD
jgi:hypothetical protein